jgi:hypothetical protein
MRPRAEQPPMKLIPEILEEWGELDVTSIARFLGIEKANVRKYLRLLKDEKKIHIAFYEANKPGPARPFFYIGNKVDAPYPIKKSPYQRKLQFIIKKRKRECQLMSWWILKPVE